MKIDILYFDGCPTWRQAAEDVQRVLRDARMEGAVQVQLVAIATEEEARRLRFLGSPTVRVNGSDVDPAVRNATTFGLQCRLYKYRGRLEASPPTDWIRAALGTESTAE